MEDKDAPISAISGHAHEPQAEAELFDRFDVALFDAMNTIFVAKAGRMQLYQELFDTMGIQADVDAIEESFTRNRARFEMLAEEERKAGRPYDQGTVLWGKINGAIVADLAPNYTDRSPEEVGDYIYNEFMGNPTWFKVDDRMRSFLQAAKGKLRIAVASNQEHSFLEKFITHFKLQDNIDQIYASDRVGVEKPDPEFFRRVVTELNVSPDRVIMIGNNPINDVAGAHEAGLTHAVHLDWINKGSDNQEGIRRVTNPMQLLDLHF